MIKNKIDLEGIVTRVQISNQSIDLKIKTKSKLYNVDLPIEINKEFELIPYHFILLGQKVRYQKENIKTLPDFDGYKNYNSSFSTNFYLKILSGPLKGKKYQFIQY